MKQSIFILILALLTFGCCANEPTLDDLFPFQNYKKVIDTCMRVYSDLLLLEERNQKYERADELVDIIVGRLVRIQSYVKQLAHDYQHEKTVSFEELEYLVQLFSYMEVTAQPLHQERFPALFNTWVLRLKQELNDVLINAPIS